MYDLVLYFVGAFAPIFDGISATWRDNVELSCVFASGIFILTIVTLTILLATVKSCIVSFAIHVSGGSKNV